MRTSWAPDEVSTQSGAPGGRNRDHHGPDPVLHNDIRSQIHQGAISGHQKGRQDMNSECNVPIGEKGKQRPCGLPVRVDGRCNYHDLAFRARESRKKRNATR
jgi:hypothetical protein